MIIIKWWFIYFFCTCLCLAFTRRYSSPEALHIVFLMHPDPVIAKVIDHLHKNSEFSLQPPDDFIGITCFDRRCSGAAGFVYKSRPRAWQGAVGGQTCPMITLNSNDVSRWLLPHAASTNRLTSTPCATLTSVPSAPYFPSLLHINPGSGSAWAFAWAQRSRQTNPCMQRRGGAMTRLIKKPELILRPHCQGDAHNSAAKIAPTPYTHIRTHWENLYHSYYYIHTRKQAGLGFFFPSKTRTRLRSFFTSKLSA